MVFLFKAGLATPMRSHGTIQSLADFTQVLPQQSTSNLYQSCEKVCGSATGLRRNIRVQKLMSMPRQLYMFLLLLFCWIEEMAFFCNEMPVTIYIFLNRNFLSVFFVILMREKKCSIRGTISKKELS